MIFLTRLSMVQQTDYRTNKEAKNISYDILCQIGAKKYPL